MKANNLELEIPKYVQNLPISASAEQGKIEWVAKLSEFLFLVVESLFILKVILSVKVVSQDYI